ncbi:hypothetical protein EDE04_7326 [Streptomyces sp. 2132.2]|nr:hypothetical protein EDE04_7326 [Streptomyces sp. 2132.2]
MQLWLIKGLDTFETRRKADRTTHLAQGTTHHTVRLTWPTDHITPPLRQEHRHVRNASDP